MSAASSLPTTTTAGPTLTLTRAKTDLLTGGEFRGAEIESIFDVAGLFRAGRGAFSSALAGRTVVMLFEKPSLRTRVTFEVAITRLGGHALYYDHQQQRIGERESVKDYGRNLERWVDAIVARVYSQRVIEELAEHTDAPVINALSDAAHPCQAMADYLTLRDRLGGLRGARVAYVGDGNNVCNSLMLLGARLGVRVVVVTPRGAEPSPDAVAAADAGAEAGGGVEIANDLDAIAGADAVYTDTWASMGASPSAERLASFEPYRVTPGVMRLARRGAVFMHCLPAHRGVEVDAEVIDGPASVVYDQAENRLHVQAALLMTLLPPAGRQRGLSHAMLWDGE